MMKQELKTDIVYELDYGKVDIDVGHETVVSVGVDQEQITCGVRVKPYAEVVEGFIFTFDNIRKHVLMRDLKKLAADLPDGELLEWASDLLKTRGLTVTPEPAPTNTLPLEPAATPPVSGHPSHRDPAVLAATRPPKGPEFQKGIPPAAWGYEAIG